MVRQHHRVGLTEESGHLGVCHVAVHPLDQVRMRASGDRLSRSRPALPGLAHHAQAELNGLLSAQPAKRRYQVLDTLERPDDAKVKDPERRAAGRWRILRATLG